MSDAHVGYRPLEDTRLRVLLGVFEATLTGIPPTYADLREHTGLSNGSLSHHIPRLVADGLLAHRPGSYRGLIITTAGVRLLWDNELIGEVGRRPVYAVTTQGLEMLERAPGRTEKDG